MSESSLAPQVVRQFTEKGLTLGTAESLTAGLIAATVADVSGASAVLMGGVVSYDPRVKHEVLGVSQEVIDTVGVVSEACALQMASGARKLLRVDVALSATGVAGPTGGTAENPVGTVWLGVSSSAAMRQGPVSTVSASPRRMRRMRAATSCTSAARSRI